jgi:hypothetical protein
MCTIGVKILEPGREFLLFKNRDFTRRHFDDRLWLSDIVFGALGLETWDGIDLASDRFSGFSIGFNARLACCDSNVRMLSDGESYDKLVEAVVEHCTTIEDAISHVRDQVREWQFSWGNLLVATPEGVTALEIRDRHVEVERDPVFVARANHHTCLGPTPNDDDSTTTEQRYRVARQGLEAARRLEDIFPLLRSHEPDPQHSLCNHSHYNTVYSYVIHWKDGEITFYVHQGHPCDGVAYTRLPITLGGSADLSTYPSAHVS